MELEFKDKENYKVIGMFHKGIRESDLGIYTDLIKESDLIGIEWCHTREKNRRNKRLY